jgi:beta-ribofuranosylaminobenzene 5'-phosphate synthase
MNAIPNPREEPVPVAAEKPIPAEQSVGLAENEITLAEERTGASVTVCCTARLHLGFFDLEGGLGRRFGSLGLSLDQPLTRLTVRHSETNRVTGPEQERVARYLTLMCDKLGGRDRRGGRDRLHRDSHHAIEVHQAMPPHSGLGSGTQIALAVATALRRLHGWPDDPASDAALLGRGARSGIGIGLFSQGGLVVDGGKGPLAEPPPLLVRAAVPEAWRVLLVLDRDRQGLSGAQERAAFASLGPMDSATAGTICRLVLMQALPALTEQDFPAFGAAISAIQAQVGDYFAPCQGGRFTSPRVGAALALLAAAGASGIGQSSWGPTGFAFAADHNEAQRLAGVLDRSDAMNGLDLLICRVLNRGASVTMT